jgi:hypothetical protein
MATVGQVYYNVLDNNSGSYISTEGLDIYSDIVSAVGAKQISKLGIQAPPGTKVILNSAKTIMVGRTGMYELDDDIYITNMYFVRPRKYVKDEDASQQAIDTGTAKMLAAEETRSEALKEFYEENPEIPEKTNEDAYKEYWDDYNEIQSAYITTYQEGLNQFNEGWNGIYTLPFPSDSTNPANYSDLYSVIVDFIYE